MSESLFLNREALLVQDALKVERVELSRGHVFVREMTAYEKNNWEQSMMKRVASGNPNDGVKFETSIDNFRIKLAVNVICDEAGNLLFTMKDIPLLNKSISAANLEKIVDVAQKINAITTEEKEKVVKNLEAEAVEDSNSASAEN